jgi:hypothetical protein
VHNDPINFLDPDGREEEWSWEKCMDVHSPKPGVLPPDLPPGWTPRDACEFERKIRGEPGLESDTPGTVALISLGNLGRLLYGALWANSPSVVASVLAGQKLADKIAHIMSDPNKNWQSLLNVFNGNAGTMVNGLAQAAAQAAAAQGLGPGTYSGANTIIVVINGMRFSVSGQIINGVFHIGTATPLP